MAARNGKCINFGLCTKADAKEILTTGDGEFSCPECGRPLEPAAGGKAAGAFPMRLVLAICFAVALAGGATYLLWPDSEQTVTVNPQDDVLVHDSDPTPQPDPNPNPVPIPEPPTPCCPQPPNPIEQTVKKVKSNDSNSTVIPTDVTRNLPPPIPEPTPPEPKPTEEPAYSGPSSGVIVWSGTVQGTDLVSIDEKGTSTGTVLSGALPGVPVIIQPQDPKAAVIASSPAPDNKYRRVVFRIRGKGTKQVTLRWTLP